MKNLEHTTYIALLRGINVGGNNKIEMPRLKKAFEVLGFINVSTYINTGNVIFETRTQEKRKLAEIIEKELLKTFGFEIKTVVQTKNEIQKISKAIPFSWENNSEQKTDVLFLWEEFDTKKTLDLIASNPDVDTLIYVSGAIVWNVQKSDYGKSGMKKFIGTKVYKHMTARNVNTVRRLRELLRIG